MSKTYCRVAPQKGAAQFLELKKLIGYEQATILWNDVISNPLFIEDYKSQLELDEDGMPTFNSLMNNPYIQNKIGTQQAIAGIEKQYTPREDTKSNFNISINEALEFNKNNPNKDKFVAYVSNKDGKLTIKLLPKTPANQQKFAEQFGIHTLNSKIRSILQEQLGLSDGTIKQAGINGITDFSKAQQLAEDLIAVADNQAGERALSEEFAHLVLEVFKDNPLIERIRNILTQEEAKLILGSSYDAYANKYLADPNRIIDEAMGKMLQLSLFNVNNAPKKTHTLLGRLANFIKKFFSKINSNDVLDALAQARSAMDLVALDILSGDLKMTKQQVQLIKRIDKLFDLDSQKASLDAILTKAIDNGVKMSKIKQEDSDPFDTELLMRQDAGLTALGIAMYLGHAMNELNQLQSEATSLSSSDPKIKFGYLRRLHNYVNMYSPRLAELNTLLAESLNDDEMGLLTQTFNVNGLELTLQQLVNAVSGVVGQLNGIYQSIASKELAKFLTPFLGKNLTNPFIEGDKVMSVEELIKTAPSDISFMDTWLASMSESSDVLLQLFNAAAMRAKDIARMSTIEYSKQIQQAYNRAKAKGVTDFTFMYGKNDDGSRANQYICTDEELNRLTDALREFYTSFMTIKSKLDEMLNDKNASLTHVIQIKKDHSFGALGLLAQGKFNEIGEYFRDKVFERSYDEDRGFGVRKTLKGFDEKEYMLVPKYYLHDIEDQNEVSDDPVSSLIAYAYMATNYKEIDGIVDALETGRTLLATGEDGRGRKVAETRGSSKVKEVLKHAGFNTESDVSLEWSKTNIAKKLDMFFNSQIYGRYLHDEGVWHVFGKDVNIQKLTSTVLGASSHLQLGFNILANTANVANGIAMTNIEAAAGRYFKASQLAKADKIYAEGLAEYMLELHNPIKKSKLALIGEYFDTKQDMDTRAKVRYDKALLTKMFGPDVAFIGQEIGDHWLYNRIAIAYLLNTKIKDDKGNDSNLYEALEVVVEDGVGRLKIKDGWDVSEAFGGESLLERNVFTHIGRQIANINQKLFGVYNKDDAVAAQQVAIGRLALQYRKWMMPAINRRFQKAQYNLTMDEWNEGYYRTAGKYLLTLYRDLKRGKFQLKANYDKLTKELKQNIQRALFEVGQFAMVLASIFAIGLLWPDKKERPWLVKFLDYQARRQKTELGVLIPQPMMIHEGFKIINSPSAGLSYVDGVLSILDATLDPTGWFEERESGPYKGMNNIEKAIYMNTPYIKNVKRATSDIDTAMQFFNK